MTDIDIDDFMNDFENTKTTKKGKANKGKGKQKEEKEVPKESKEVVIEEKTKENKIEENNQEQNKTKETKENKEILQEKDIKKDKEKDVVKNDIKPSEQKLPEETQKDEAVEQENEEQPEEIQDKAAVGEKKKKIVKKVVVKKGAKGKKEDLFLKLAKEQAKLNKEAEEQAKKDREEEERRFKEEEERIKREEEEKKKREKEEAEEKQRRLEERKKLNLSEKEYNELMKKKEETLKMLKEKGINSIDELTKTNVPTKFIKKKHVVQKKENSNDNKPEANDDTVDDLKHRKVSKDETEKNTNVNENADVDDWENELENDTINSRKKSNVNNNESEDVAIKEKKLSMHKKSVDSDDDEDKIRKMRSPIICILGHVDTGKTKLLDKLRNTNIQKGEAGGITQQIGATRCPLENLQHLIDSIPEKEYKLPEIKLPGLLIIDTPGHASFQNLRVRGQSLCDIAIIVIDIMHGLEIQTIDSLKMVKEKQTPFIIALNKIDCLYGWKKNEWKPFRDTYAKQNTNAQHEFKKNLEKIQTQIIKEVGLNTSLYYENPNIREYFSICPTSAITGEGIPDLINMCLYFCQTLMPKRLVFKPKKIECSVLEVKVLEKVGTTIDIILVNGSLKIGDKFIVAGLNGPIKTDIKYILTPHPMKELRVKSEYIYNKEISGAVGCKIFALNLEEALAGSPLLVYKNDKEADEISQEISDDCLSFLNDDMLNKNGRGVLLIASSLGAMEAIMKYLEEEKIPIAGVNLGHVQKKDVIRILTIHNKEKDKNKEILKEDLCILAFDVHVSKDAQEYADKNGVTILTADIIYHLKDKYAELVEKCFKERKDNKMKEAIFPFKLKIIPKCIFNRQDPIIIGVNVLDGLLKKDTPVFCVEKKKLLGVVESIQKEHKEVNEAVKNNEVSIRIKGVDKHVAFKTHFDENDTLISNISRLSIDRIKEYFCEDLEKNPEYIELIKEFKGILEIK